VDSCSGPRARAAARRKGERRRHDERHHVEQDPERSTLRRSGRNFFQPDQPPPLDIELRRGRGQRRRSRVAAVDGRGRGVGPRRAWERAAGEGSRGGGGSRGRWDSRSQGSAHGWVVVAPRRLRHKRRTAEGVPVIGRAGVVAGGWVCCDPAGRMGCLMHWGRLIAVIASASLCGHVHGTWPTRISKYGGYGARVDAVCVGVRRRNGVECPL